MDIQEFIKRKSELTDEINAKLRDFQAETGVCISNFEVTTQSNGMGMTLGIYVEPICKI